MRPANQLARSVSEQQLNSARTTGRSSPFGAPLGHAGRMRALDSIVGGARDTSGASRAGSELLDCGALVVVVAVDVAACRSKTSSSPKIANALIGGQSTIELKKPRAKLASIFVNTTQQKDNGRYKVHKRARSGDTPAADCSACQTDGQSNLGPKSQIDGPDVDIWVYEASLLMNSVEHIQISSAQL